ncbi:hypothetical protein [Stutzerimonas azotifigens]|uniref:hypothetical protein n=1 Tax=Stutzerimonas azotifigens TaxID=291995 RepID=UPI0004011586|nr:hypothetical protein [Stutzerimonas azotifigens]
MWIVSASMLLISTCLLVSLLASLAYAGHAFVESRKGGLTPPSPHAGKDAVNRA